MAALPVASSKGPASPSVPTTSDRSGYNLSDAGVAEKLQKLEAAQDRMKRLLDDDNQFANYCEEVFTEFRRPVVQLRNSPDALDKWLDKTTPVRFMCKFCKARPPYHNRCEEVLKVLMLSDAWKKTFQADPEADALPSAIATDLMEKPPGADVVAVVQRCSRAQVLVNAERSLWQQVGRGLFVCVSFGSNASEEKVKQVARSLLTAPLSNSDKAGKPESVITVCKRGEEQGIVLVLQPSLSSEVEAGAAEVASSKDCGEDKREAFYKCLEDALTAAANEHLGSLAGVSLPKIVAAKGNNGTQSWEVNSDGMMHSFSF